MIKEHVCYVCQGCIEIKSLFTIFDLKKTKDKHKQNWRLFGLNEVIKAVEERVLKDLMIYGLKVTNDDDSDVLHLTINGEFLCQKNIREIDNLQGKIKLEAYKCKHVKRDEHSPHKSMFR